MKHIPKRKVLQIGNFNVLYTSSKPPRLEAKMIFSRNDISQKLIFSLMQISYVHGFGCSAPIFEEDSTLMSFFIRVFLPSTRSLNNYLKKIYNCLIDIEIFINFFNKQLDFSQLDISMFNGINMENIYLEKLSAIRDQYYFGSWDKFHNDLKNSDQNETANIISKLKKFEEINKKDIGFVGHKLTDTIQMIVENMQYENESN